MKTLNQIIILWAEGVAIYICMAISLSIGMLVFRVTGIWQRLSDFEIIATSRGVGGDVLYAVLFFVWVPICVAWTFNWLLSFRNSTLGRLFGFAWK